MLYTSLRNKGEHDSGFCGLHYIIVVTPPLCGGVCECVRQTLGEKSDRDYF